MTPLIDTDICVDHSRGRAKAIAFINGLSGPPKISAVTVGGLYAGVFPHERPALDAFVRFADVLPVTTEIGRRAGEFRNRWKASHKVDLPDCLIAATADVHGLALHTLNARHFPMLPVTVPYVRP